MNVRAAGLLFVAVLATGCGVPLMKLPAGPGERADDAGAALAQATATCRRVRTLAAEVSVEGSVAGRRVRARLEAGVAAPASARLEAMASFGAPFFIFVTTGNDAAVLLPRDRRLLEHASPRAVLEAVAGVPLDAAELRAVLTGCVLEAGETDGRAMGDSWRLVPSETGPHAYLHRDRAADPWRLVAMVQQGRASARGWRAEFSDFSGDLPETIRVTSASGVGRDQSFDLRLRLSQVTTNVPLEAGVFRLEDSGDTEPITLDELASSGPLAQFRRSAADER